MKCAVVTVAVGEKYLSEYNQLFRTNTERYCEKYGYDFHVLTDYIFDDPKYRQPVFVDIMKWTIPFHSRFKEYDRVAIVDADMLITPDCPPLESIALHDKIGIVDEYSQPSPEIRYQIQTANNYLDRTPSEYYNVHLGVELDIHSIFNGGFIVCIPKLHAEWFRTIFHRHVDGTLTAKHHPFHFEQASLGVELYQSKMFTILDNRWNVIWPIVSNRIAIGDYNLYDFHKEVFMNSYIVHYCAHCGWDLAEYARER